MKLIQWSFHNIHMPMLEDDNGELFCTSETLCESLGITKESLRQYSKRYADELSGLSVNEFNAKEFIAENKEKLGIQRLRKDLHIWTENDMLIIAMLAKSDVSKEFRWELLKFIKTNARRGYVSQEQYQYLATRLDKLEAAVEYAKPVLEEYASAAGMALVAQKRTKGLRN